MATAKVINDAGPTRGRSTRGNAASLLPIATPVQSLPQPATAAGSVLDEDISTSADFMAGQLFAR